jgi:chromosome segregation ATPase
MTEVKRPRRPRRPAGSRNHPVTSSILGAIESGASVIEELHGEMEEWASSLESNSMEHLPKYEEVDEARNALDGPKDELQSIDLPEEIAGVEVKYTQDTRQSANSRSGRLNNALDELRAAEAGLEEWLEDNPALEANEGEPVDVDPEDGPEEELVTQDEADAREELREKAQEALDTLQSQISELEGVSFPGMY